jgi:hypothetical protein
LEWPEGAISVVRYDERTLGHECNNGKAQPAIPSSREGAPPDGGDGTEKRDRDCTVASPKRPCLWREPLACHPREDGMRAVFRRSSRLPPCLRSDSRAIASRAKQNRGNRGNRGGNERGVPGALIASRRVAAASRLPFVEPRLDSRRTDEKARSGLPSS